jgi:hypothetical protein
LTPAQVRELPVRDVIRLPLIAELVDKIQEDERKRQQKG